MNRVKVAVLAVALLVSATTVVGVGVTQSWFSDTETTEVTITTAPMFTLDGEGWDGANPLELRVGPHYLVPNYSSCTVSIPNGVTVKGPGSTEPTEGLLLKGVTYTITGSGIFVLTYSPDSNPNITLDTGGTP